MNAPLTHVTDDLLPPLPRFPAGRRVADWNMRLAKIEVIGAGMMYGMAALPGKIRHQQAAVQNVTDRVLKPVVFRKRSMTTLVGDDPAAGARGPSNDGVGDPRRQPRPGERDVRVCESSAADGHCLFRDIASFIVINRSQEFGLSRTRKAGFTEERRRLSATPRCRVAVGAV